MSVNLIADTDAHMTRSGIYMPRQKSFYPSEASARWVDHHGIHRVAGNCIRQSWYRLSGKYKPAGKDPYGEWIFALGKAVEEILVEQWKQMGILVDHNVKFYDADRNISGEVDAILIEPDTKKMYCVECVTQNSYIPTNNGIKKASEINLHDQLLASKSQNTNIYNRQIKQVTNSTIYNLKHRADGIPVWFSEDHPILTGKIKVRRPVKNNRKREYYIESTEFKSVKDITKGDYVAIPNRYPSFSIEQQEKAIDVDDFIQLECYCDNSLIQLKTNKGKKIRHRIENLDLFYKFLGLYLAEGSVDNDGRISIGLHQDENGLKQQAEDFFNYMFLDGSTRQIANSKGIEVYTNSVILADFFTVISGRNCYTKRIHHNILMNASLEQRKQLLTYWLLGDGGVVEEGKACRGTTSSIDLAWQMYLIASELDFNPRLKKIQPKDNSVIYNVEFVFNSKNSEKSPIFEENRFVKIRDIVTKQYDGLLYNFEVDQSNTYTAGGIITHNCKSFYGYYASKEVCGNKSQKGAPKTSQLLQALIYVDQGLKHNLWDYVKMVYYARDSANRAEFDITLKEEGGELRPCINGVTDYRFTMQDIYDRYAELDAACKSDTPPPRDFDIEWSREKVLERKKLGEVSKTAFEAWQKNPKKNPIGDWQCFAPETLVWLENGDQKEIQKIKAGDTVVGLSGPTKVVRIESKTNTAQCLKIKPACALDTITTEDHEWLVATWDSNYQYYNNSPFMLEKVQAKNLITINEDQNTRMSLLCPIFDTSSKVEVLTPEAYRLLGYYAAEGCLANPQNGRYYQVCFTIHPEEQDIAQDIINCAIKEFQCHYQDKIVVDTREEEPRTYRVLKFFSVKFADFIRTRVFGKKAHTKRLGISIMKSPTWAVREFINCAHLGDGSRTTQRNNPNCYTIATSSRILCNQYQQLLWRLKIPARATYGNLPKICFEKYQSKQGYRVDWQGDFSTIKFVTINKNQFAALPIRSVSKVSAPSVVWDLEVESKHHLFYTESGLASNCNYCKMRDICYGEHADIP